MPEETRKPHTKAGAAEPCSVAGGQTGGDLLCSLCGCPLEKGAGFTGSGKQYCCEGCYLGDKKYHYLKAELDNAYLAFAEALAKAVDIREHETGLHSKRVACHTMVLAKHFTDEKEKLRQIYWGSLLHDIGKIGISDKILLKKGSLTKKEWAEMESHPERGFSILSTIPFMRSAADIVLSHEEHYDGSGYPNNLKGDDIPLGARIFSIIDTLDAMISDRSYRRGVSFDDSKNEIIQMGGSQFDPEVVEIFILEEVVLREMTDSKCGIVSLDFLHTHKTLEEDKCSMKSKTRRL